MACQVIWAYHYHFFLTTTQTDKKMGETTAARPFFYGIASLGIRLSSRQINDLSFFDSSLPSSSGSHLLAFPFAFTQSVASDRRRWPRFFPLLLRCYIHQCPSEQHSVSSQYSTAEPLLASLSSPPLPLTQRQLSNPRPGESESVPL